MIKIFIAETSCLIRKGLVRLLEQLSGATQFYVAEESLDPEQLRTFNPDIVFINSVFPLSFSLEEVLAVLPTPVRLIKIENGSLTADDSSEHISILESKSSLVDKINSYLKQIETLKGTARESEELTPREKLILKNVTLGYTNKEIAARLFISTHTVITHRKNITRKLEIKTVSGLTVYAILNNIIKMEDIS